jgi:excisionase family DNA binding protein
VSVKEIDWVARICRHITPDGSVIVPSRIAAALEAKAGVTPDRRIALRGTDPEAYEVLAALHLAALSHSSGTGTETAAVQRNLQLCEEWLTTTEAAQVVGVSDRCIRKWIASQRLPARRHGNRYLVNRQHLTVRAMAA